MYTSKVFSWLAAGVIGVGSSAAFAQYEPQQQDEIDSQNEVAPRTEEGMQDYGVQEGESDELRHEEDSLQSEQQLQQDDEQGLGEDAWDDADQQTLRGTVMDASEYLIHGEEGAQDQQQDAFGQAGEQQDDQQVGQAQMRQQGQQGQPKVLVTEDGEAYLILERQDDGLQRPLEADPAGEDRGLHEGQDLQDEQGDFGQEGIQQDQNQQDDLQGTQSLQQPQEQDDDVRAPVRDRLAPRADHGTRERTSESDQQQDWERHPGEWQSEAGASDADVMQDEQAVEGEQSIDDRESRHESDLVGPAQFGGESSVYQQLRVGEEVSLTGEVHERGGLRAIVIDEYGIEFGQQQDDQMPQTFDEPTIDEPAQDEQFNQDGSMEQDRQDEFNVEIEREEPADQRQQDDVEVEIEDDVQQY